MPGRRSLLIALLLAAMAGSTIAGLWIGRQAAGSSAWGKAPPAVQAVMWPEPRPLADFDLRTQHGEPFGPADLAGRWSFVFFGYLGCPDVCPTSLHAMREMRRHLAERGSGGDPQFLFVSVDPDNDQPGEMADYLAWYDPEFIGLRGPAPEIGRLADSMAVRYETFVDDSGHQSIDHTSSVMMIDPTGRMVGALPPPLRPEQMVERFERLQAYLSDG